MTNVQEKMSNVQGQVVNAVESAAAKVSDFFQGNPFESVIGRKIGMFITFSAIFTEIVSIFFRIGNRCNKIGY